MAESIRRASPGGMWNTLMAESIRRASPGGMWNTLTPTYDM